eukprot:scaffold1307_cov200-Pinguiococcus_pyrenoidosus.AAC.57
MQHHTVAVRHDQNGQEQQRRQCDEERYNWPRGRFLSTTHDRYHRRHFGKELPPLRVQSFVGASPAPRPS